MANRTSQMASTLTPVRENTTSPQATPKAKKRPQEIKTPEAPPPTTEAAFRTQKHPWLDRKALGEDYDKPITKREGWWRTYIRETPLPGAYDSKHFLLDLERRPNTYRFKSDGRKLDPHPHGKGATLLPGAYEFHHFLEDLERNPATYNFRATDRSKQNLLIIGQKDKEIDVSPNAYGVEHYLKMAVDKQASNPNRTTGLDQKDIDICPTTYSTELIQSLTSDKQPSKHSMFRSSSKRFPSRPFRPRDGPGPGNYEYSPEKSKIAVSSSFKSRTPRFSTSHTRVPGPGTYEKTYQSPQPDTLAKMGRQHGLFFSSAFHV